MSKNLLFYIVGGLIIFGFLKCSGAMEPTEVQAALDSIATLNDSLEARGIRLQAVANRAARERADFEAREAEWTQRLAAADSVIPDAQATQVRTVERIVAVADPATIALVDTLVASFDEERKALNDQIDVLTEQNALLFGRVATLEEAVTGYQEMEATWKGIQSQYEALDQMRQQQIRSAKRQRDIVVAGLLIGTGAVIFG